VNDSLEDETDMNQRLKQLKELNGKSPVLVLEIGY